MQLWAFPETTPKEVGRERRKADRVGISFKIFCKMKKIFLLLAFAFCANVAFASKVALTTKPVVEKMNVESIASWLTTTPETGCILCAKCRENLLICATAGNCEAAAILLSEMWEALHCEGSGTSGE